MPSATTTVFETYELLEMILAAIPPRKILVVQRVCKSWQAVIAQSIKIKKLLFQHADGAPVQPTSKLPLVNAETGVTLVTYPQELSFNAILPGTLTADDTPNSRTKRA